MIPDPPADATSRFSRCVEDYVRYRPGYPPEAIAALQDLTGLTRDWTVADIGSGTGIFAKMLLDNGNTVFGIEPNKEMREAGDRHLAGYDRFHSLEGTAEATGLPPQSVELVTAAQAFHWFDTTRARAEFRRILKPPAWVALVWNDRVDEGSPFLEAYEALLKRLAVDYKEVNHRKVTRERLEDFFQAKVEECALPNAQSFDRDGLYGRAMSSSYVPPKDHPNYPAFAQGLREIYAAHNVQGRVDFLYTTRVFVGRIH